MTAAGEHARLRHQNYVDLATPAPPEVRLAAEANEQEPSDNA